MSTQLIPWAAKVPAYLRSGVSSTAALFAGISGGYKVLSIKGKTWTIVDGGERTIITKPDEPDEPASAIQVVIIKASRLLSKSFYLKFEEGAGEKPVCHSNNGKTPELDAQTPQSTTCAACPKNVWGSGQDGKGKACKDVRRVAVAPVHKLDEPMLLRVPPDSLKELSNLGKEIYSKDPTLDLCAVVVKMRFDPAKATPKILFSPVGLLPEDLAMAAVESAKSEMLSSILGLEHEAHEESEDTSIPLEKVAAAAPKAPEPPKPAPVAAKPTTPTPPKVNGNGKAKPEVTGEHDELDDLLGAYDD